MTQMFSFLAVPLGWLLSLLYSFIGNYGWALILFTFIIRIVMIPLSLMQQKSTARTAAYQPMIQEIQKKWAKDKNRLNEEIQKFYQENNIKMTGGCLPMLVNFAVIFGIIGVVQAPLNYVIHMPEDQLNNAIVITAAADEELNAENAQRDYTFQSTMIGEMQNNPQHYIDGVDVDGKTIAVDAEWVKKVEDFNFKFLGLELYRTPALKFNVYLIMPILSVLTMLASQLIVMKTSGQSQMQGGNSMWIMTLVTGVMFAFFAFRVPLGFSLYYTTSNVVMTLQQLIVRRVYSPEKIREQVMAEIEEKKKQKKAKKVVKVRDAEGKVEQKELSDSELARLRLAKARELDAQRYAEEEKKPDKTAEKDDDIAEMAEEAPAKPEDVKEEPEETAGGEEVQELQDDGVNEQETYKPGRRKRARQKKEDKSFAELEQEREAQEMQGGQNEEA